jgi:hypothetical protein
MPASRSCVLHPRLQCSAAAATTGDCSAQSRDDQVIPQCVDAVALDSSPAHPSWKISALLPLCWRRPARPLMAGLLAGIAHRLGSFCHSQLPQLLLAWAFLSMRASAALQREVGLPDEVTQLMSPRPLLCHCHPRGPPTGLLPVADGPKRTCLRYWASQRVLRPARRNFTMAARVCCLQARRRQ